ncbi:MAG TPA: hypothetical protein PKW33_02815 [Anaerolineaceae bacterium]|nr:hypothetical protein [Anaerolineaceae bacterium]HPN50493.1 hypothetical protein [Anaerolineaceae bacterium]
MQTWIKRLPLLALLGLAAAVICLALGTQQRAQMLTENPQTRGEMQNLLNQLSTAPVDTLDGYSAAALETLKGNPAVASAWIIAPDGAVTGSWGSTAFKGNIADRLPAETQRVLESLPPATLSAEQALLLRSAAAAQAEGEHNDIYRHQVRALHKADGSLAGTLAVAYEANPSASDVDAGWVAILIIFLLGGGLYWLSVAAWVGLDARQHGEKAFIWLIFALIGNLAALLAYLLVRTPRRE